MYSLLPRRLKIPAGARVLEIGSGARPHPQSTVLLDRFLEDASHREGRAVVSDTRPFVIADGEALPFRDGSFDYVICMHVLEHVSNPAKMLDEIQRVASAGYIETPTELFEWLFSAPPYTEIHLWFVNMLRDELLLTRKTPGNMPNPYGPLLDNLRREDGYLERWLEKRPDLFTVQYEWTGRIKYRFCDIPPTAEMTQRGEFGEILDGRMSHHDFFWGSGLWGFKRWLYANWIHPVWRRRAKRLLSPFTAKK